MVFNIKQEQKKKKHPTLPFWQYNCAPIHATIMHAYHVIHFLFVSNSQSSSDRHTSGVWGFFFRYLLFNNGFPLCFHVQTTELLQQWVLPLFPCSDNSFFNNGFPLCLPVQTTELSTLPSKSQKFTLQKSLLSDRYLLCSLGRYTWSTSSSKVLKC